MGPHRTIGTKMGERSLHTGVPKRLSFRRSASGQRHGLDMDDGLQRRTPTRQSG
jgi:hypothetical protein